MAFRLAELFVEVTAKTDPVDRALARVKSSLSSALSGMGGLAAKGANAIFSAFSSAAGLAASAMKVALVGVGIALAAGTAYAVNAASNLNETVSKTAVVFGESSGRVMQAAQEMADAFGIPKQEFLDAASMFGLVASSMGKAKGEAAETAVHFARLAANAASFHNIPVADALEKIRAGLTGESEPLKALGVMMDEAATKAEALRLGLARQGQELSNSAKFSARASLITKGLATSQGDLARTADGVANRLRELQGRFQNLAADLGQFLLPAVKRLTGELAGAMKGLEGFVRDNEATFTAWGASLETAIGVGASAWKHWREALEVAKEFAKEKVQNVKEIFEWLAANVPPVMDRIRDAIVDGFEDGMKRALEVVRTNSHEMSKILLEVMPVSGVVMKAVEGANGAMNAKGLAPRSAPRPFVPLSLSSSPALAGALSNFGNLHSQDQAASAEAARLKANAETNAEIAEKSAADRRTNPHHLRDMRESDEQRERREAAGEWARVEADQKRMEDRSKARTWQLNHPYARQAAQAPAMADAFRNPSAEMKFAIQRANQKVGVSDADSYHRELTEGALKSGDIQRDMLKVATDQSATLKEIAANTKGGGGGKGATAWG
jgi:hypothetical protein